MRTFILLGVIAFVATDPRYYILEKVDVDKVINNIDVLKEVTDCFLEKIVCNNVYESYRVNTMEAIQQSCKRCTPYVKHGFYLYLQALKQKVPDAYLDLRYKYDPENKYFDAHEAELQKYADKKYSSPSI